MRMFKILVAFLFLLKVSVVAEKLQTLKIGFLPYTNALNLIKIHQPLRDFLSKKLDIPVEIVTSSNYEAMYFDTKEGVFDLIVTGPHFGVMHIQEGFIPLYRYDTALKPLLVVKKDSDIDSPKKLLGKQIALSTYLSVSSVGGLQWLKNEGLVAGRDFTTFNAASHTSAIQSVLLGESAAAITTHTPIKQLAKESVDAIKILESPYAMPHLFTLANPKLGEKTIQKIKNALLAFAASEEGKVYFEKTGYKGYTEISKEDINAMSAYIEVTKGYLDAYKR